MNEYDDARDQAFGEALTRTWQEGPGTRPDPERTALARAAAVAQLAQPVTPATVTHAARWRRRGLAAAVAVGVAGLGATGAAAAAEHSLPGDSTYPVKRAIEQVRIGLSFGDRAETRTLLAITESRLEETVEASADREEALEDSVGGYLTAVAALRSEVATLAAEDPREPLVVEVNAALARHQEVLASLLDEVPAPARPALERAILGGDAAPAPIAPWEFPGVPVPAIEAPPEPPRGQPDGVPGAPEAPSPAPAPSGQPGGTRPEAPAPSDRPGDRDRPSPGASEPPTGGDRAPDPEPRPGSSRPDTEPGTDIGADFQPAPVSPASN